MTRHLTTVLWLAVITVSGVGLCRSLVDGIELMALVFIACLLLAACDLMRGREG